MHLRLFAAASAMLFVCMPALANPVSITPGQTVTPGQDTYGGSLVDTLTHSGASGTVSYTDSVYADPNNPMCAGCYDFVLEVSSTDLFTTVTGVTSTDFDGSKYELMVAYMDNGGTAPGSVTEGPGGSKVTFNTDISIFDDSPDSLIIYTNAMDYTSGSITFTTSDLISDPPGFAPSGPAVTGVTPEPSSLLLLSTGAMGMAGLVRRRLA